MQRDHREQLDLATVAAADGATVEEILEETSLALEDIRNVVRIEEERRKRREARRGKL